MKLSKTECEEPSIWSLGVISLLQNYAAGGLTEKKKGKVEVVLVVEVNSIHCFNTVHQYQSKMLTKEKRQPDVWIGRQ